MPTKSIFFPLWFAICRRIRKQSAAKEKRGGGGERVKLREAKRQGERERGTSREEF